VKTRANKKYQVVFFRAPTIHHLSHPLSLFFYHRLSRDSHHTSRIEEVEFKQKTPEFLQYTRHE